MSYSKGLEGVVVGETAISHVEGELGRLSYRAYAIEELVDLPYEAVVWLVLFGDLPDDIALTSLLDFFHRHESLSEANLVSLASFSRDLHPMAVLQAMIPVLDIEAECFNGLDTEATKGLAIIAKLPGLVAAHHRCQNGVDIKPPTSESTGLARFLEVFTDSAVNTEHLEILKVVQILQIDHSFNAGTFATRVVSSTLAPVDAVLAAGVGTLAGILHGGADEAALRDAKRVGSPEAAVAYVDNLLASKGKLMGMGHREYKIVDPRAVILKPLAEKLCVGSAFENDYQTLVALEQAFNQVMAAKGKPIWANLEFYKGAVYQAMGIPMNYFTAVFALSRSVGWLAHFIESRADNRLIRPKALYVGQKPRSLVSQ